MAMTALAAIKKFHRTALTHKTTRHMASLGSLILFGLALLIAIELISHGNEKLGLYFLLTQLLQKIEQSSGGEDESAEHIIHITGHH